MSIDAVFRPTFADLRVEIERRVQQGATTEEISTLVDQFLFSGDAPPSVPLIEYDGTVTWLYRDATAENVSVIGDIIGYDPDKTRMERVQGSDLFYLSIQLPLDARIEYVFAVDNPRGEENDTDSTNAWLGRCKNDPLNPRHIITVWPLRAFSILEMPNARAISELNRRDSEFIGSVAFHVVGSAALNNWRRVWIYLPPGYNPEARRYPTLYLNDGESYLLSARAPQIIDALLTMSEIVPPVVVFIESKQNRAAETYPNRDFVEFLAEELVPWVDWHYATSADPKQRVIGGASFGATASLFAALERPDVFGRVLAQSPILHDLIDELPMLLEQNIECDLPLPSCYLDVGRYEPAMFVQNIQTLCNMLLTRGVAVSYQGFGGDHSFLGWQSTFADALRFHFGVPTFSADLGRNDSSAT